MYQINSVLPVEIFDHIFSYLNLKENCQAGLVCKFWEQQTSFNLMWKKVFTKRFGHINNPDCTWKSLYTKTLKNLSTLCYTQEDIPSDNKVGYYHLIDGIIVKKYGKRCYFYPNQKIPNPIDLRYGKVLSISEKNLEELILYDLIGHQLRKFTDGSNYFLFDYSFVLDDQKILACVSKKVSKQYYEVALKIFEKGKDPLILEETENRCHKSNFNKYSGKFCIPKILQLRFSNSYIGAISDSNFIFWDVKTGKVHWKIPEVFCFNFYLWKDRALYERDGLIRLLDLKNKKVISAYVTMIDKVVFASGKMVGYQYKYLSIIDLENGNKKNFSTSCECRAMTYGDGKIFFLSRNKIHTIDVNTGKRKSKEIDLKNKEPTKLSYDKGRLAIFFKDGSAYILRFIPNPVRLPPEIWVKIFSYLNERDLCVAAQVCRSWRDLSDANSLWLDLFESRWPSEEKRKKANKSWKQIYMRKWVSNGDYLKKKEAIYYSTLCRIINKNVAG